MNRLICSLSLAAVGFPALLVAPASEPSWWLRRGVIATDSQGNRQASFDYAAANQGQLKNLARAARDELEAVLGPGAAGVPINTMIDQWLANTGSASDYAMVNLGQLKATSKPFFARMAAFGLRPANSYPWTGEGADDYVAVNIGQLKNVFSFPVVSVDSDGDGLPDAWEMMNFNFSLSGTEWSDPDNDGRNNLREFLEGTDPMVSDGPLPAVSVLQVLTPLE